MLILMCLRVVTFASIAYGSQFVKIADGQKFTYCNIYYEILINILLHYMNLDQIWSIMLDISTRLHYNNCIQFTSRLDLMYDDLSLDYTYDQAFNLDEDYADRYELDENDEYARESKDFQELAYQHYA